MIYGIDPAVARKTIDELTDLLDVREKLAVSRAGVPEVLARLVGHRAIGEVVVLSTCNRVEVYAAAPRRGASDAELGETARAATGWLEELGGTAIRPYLLSELGRPAVLHLFRVAA